MNPPNASLHMTEMQWRGIILALSAGVIAFTLWCLTHGITTIFMHLYYFPIVLLAYRYRWKGFGLATLLALAYFGLSLFYDAGQTEVILGAAYRVLVFVGIGAVIAYLSDRLALETRAARESAEIRERYISLAPAIILVLDRNGTITYLNPKGGEILECTPHGVTGKSWFDQFLPEYDRNRVIRLFSTLVAGQVRPDQAFENPVLTRGGTEKTIRWHNTVLHDESGVITGILGFGEDITGEKQTQDSLRKMQQFQESVITNANVWISVLAHDGSTILVWNDAAEAISGYKKSDVVGKKTVWKLLYPDNDYRRKVTGDIQRIIGKDEFLENFETEIRCADGTAKTIVWNTRALRDNKDSIIGYIAIGRDITEQKRLENELRESEGRVRKKLAAILEPEGDIGTLELSDIFDQQALQALMDDFFRLTGIGVAILDNAGKILVATGWQDICTKFHRVHPGTNESCIESDLMLTQGIEPGKFKRYKYKNNLWDISTPIIIAGNQAGYLFLGQFFFEDETPDRELFRRQAQQYGFDEKEYLSALDRVPRWKRDTVENVMQFYVRLINTLSTLSYNNLRLARTLAERDTLMQSLRDSERKFHTLADWTSDWEYWVDPAQQIRYMSPSVERITGYRAEEFIRDPDLVNRIVHMDDRAAWEQHIPLHKKDTCGDDPVEIGIRITAIDGSVRWISHICREICDDKGVPIGRRVSNRDITDKKIAEEEVRLSNVILSTQQETSPDGILIVDESGKILSFNRRFTEIWGISSEVIASRIDERVLSFVLENLINPEEFLTRVRYLYDHREEKSGEEVLLKDGRVLDRYSAPILGENSRYFGRVWYFHDITERKRAEEILKSSDARMRVILESMIAGVVIIDPETHTIIDANSVAVNIIGAEKGVIIGSVCHNYICPAETGACPITDLNQVVDHSEKLLIRADGTKIPVLKSVVPISLNNRTYLLESFIDISQIKKAESALRENEEKYRAFFTTSRDSVFITTVDGSWVDFNDAAMELFGYENREDLLKVKVSRIYANQDERDAHIRYIRENGYSFEYPVDLRKKDGTIINTLITTVPRHDASGNIIGFQGSIRDITEQKAIQDRMQKLLRLQEEQVRVINTSPAVAFLWRAEENWPVETVSSNISNFGYSVDDFESGRIVYSSIIHPDDLGQVSAEVESNSENHIDDFRQIYRIFGKDGSEYWIDDFTHIRRDNAGTITHYEGLILDITDRRKAEDALALEKQRMESLLSLSLMGQKPDPEIIAEAVEDAIRLTGSTIGYLATLNEDESVMTMQYWSKSAHESCKVIDKPIVYAVEKTGLWGEAVRQRKPMVTNDYAADSPFKHGTPGGHVPLVRHMNIPVFDGDHIVAVAGVGNKSVDYNEGDVRQLQLLMQGWWQVTVRKRAEAALWESREHYRALIDYSQLAIAVLDVNHRIIMVNPRFSTLFKKPVGDFVGKYCFNEFEKRTSVCPHCPGVRAMVTRKPEETETEGVLDDGTRFSARIRAVPFFGPDGAVKGFVEMVEDITDRKRAEEAIARSEERYRTLAEASPDQIFINDRNGTILYANTMGLKLFGLPYDQVVGKQRKDLFPPEQLVEQDAAFRKVFDSGEPVRNETRTRFGEQEQWIDTNLVPLKDAAGHITAVLGVAREITERKQMEEALRESRQLFSDIISFLPDPTFVIDRDGKVIAWNRALEQLSGISAGDIIGEGDHAYSLWQYGKGRPVLIDLVLNKDQDAARLNYTDIHRDGSTITAQTEIIHAETGKKIPLSLVASPLIDSLGNMTGAIESMRDVSRLKEAEAELARMNKDLEQIVRDRTRALEEEVVQRMHAEKDVQDALSYTRSVIEANPDLVAVLDGNGMVLDVNAAAELMTGVPRDQMIGSAYISYLVDDDTLHTVFSRLLETGRADHSIRIRRIDGHITPVSVNATRIGGNDTADVRIIIAGHDITRQKQDEEAIRASLEEKVLLLREVHHRVKNNLQIIISLTNLQIRQTGDPAVKQIMAETQNRVRAMSLVHEKLYRSESLSHIDFADYTRFLVTQLFSFYGIDTRRVRLEFTLGKIMVDIVTAVPLGILMNELISNALKHAFPDGREGTISISSVEEGNLITLVVRDNGVGIPEELDWKNAATLGMRLINSLVDQVDGTITLDRKNGTAFTITVKRDLAAGGAA
jgi:PAS domain S-box-containing protein